MKNIIIAPDSFKGTLSASEICEIISSTITRYIPCANIKCIPMADGGEGMTDSYIKAVGGIKTVTKATAATGLPIKCEFGILKDNTAVIEVASCAGLPLMGDRPDPVKATTYGVGELINAAVSQGCEKILIGLGGSATNDLGIGMAGAIGYRFFDSYGIELEPTAENMCKVEHILAPQKMIDADITVACDVSNPLCGPEGATFVFGKQKGVKEEDMEKTDLAMEHFAKVIENEFNKKIRYIPGAGAAGGLGAAMIGFLNAELKAGADMLLDIVGYEDLLKSADIVFTGEGRMDGQSIAGKVPVAVGRRAKLAGVPCIALCGSVGEGAEKSYEEGITSVFSSIKDFDCKNRGKEAYIENIRFLTDSVMRVLLLGEDENPGAK